MAHMTLQFLGQFRVRADQTPITDFHSEKARALLVYLALEPGEHTRATLASLFWPYVDAHYARTNLRNTLYQLRQTLNRAASNAADQLLTVARESVSFKPENATVDALHFLALLEDAPADASAELAALEEAVELYQGDLFLGFGLGDAPAFEEWLLFRRELFHHRALTAYQRLAIAYESVGRYEQAHAVVGRLLMLDPYREETYQQSMRLLARLGQPSQVRQRFAQLRKILFDEFSAEPSAETLALVAQIDAGAFDKTPEALAQQEPTPGTPPLAAIGRPSQPLPHHASAADSHPLALDLRDVPDPGPFFGRVHEQQQLTQWLLHEHSRVVAILGIGGMGKTSLAAHWVRTVASIEGTGQVEVVLWRSLLNAPPLTELLPPLLQTLSDQQLSEMPASLDEQLRLLLSFLRAKRVLLVLDNFESVLEPEQAGSYRPGYAPYGQLIQQVASLGHQSHLLLTSRERPRGYVRLERDDYPVHSLQLAGLDENAGRNLLAQRGIAAKGDAESQLIKRYSGNPLALKLVADTVDDIFGGDIVEFLTEETLVFDDVRDVLDQHFARLSALERDLLFRLAVERAETSLSMLRDNLLDPPSQPKFVEALRDLQRRSLIERQGNGFLLQNVINEYLTDRLVAEAIGEVEQGELNLLHRHALLKAQAKEYVRQSQARLILQPIAEQLVDRLGSAGVKSTLKGLLDGLRQTEIGRRTYAGGNIFNLLRQLQIDIGDFDFSQLSIWQAYLQGIQLSNVNFAESDLTHSTFTHAFGMVEGIAISPDGQLLASGGDGGAITIWRLSDFRPVMTLEGHSNTVTALAFSPLGGKLASVSIDASLRMWDIQSGQAIWATTQDQALFSVAFSPDGRWIASGCKDPFVYVWESNSADLRYICVLDAHPYEGIRAVAFHPTGKWLAAATDNGAIFLWDMANYCQSTAGVADARRQVVQAIISVVDEDGLNTLAFSPDGAYFATGGKRGLIKVWNATTLEKMQTLPGHRDSVRRVIWSPDSKKLYSVSYDTTVRLWDIDHWQCDAVMTQPGIVWSAALSPDGETLATCGGDSTIRIWEVKPDRHFEMVKILQGYRSMMPAAAFSRSGQLLALGDSLGSIRLWDLTQSGPQCVHTLQSHDWIEALAFSPDGRYLASTGATTDNSIHLWDVATKQCIAVLVGHTQRVRSLVFAPNSIILASAGRDFAVRLWDLQNLPDYKPLQVLHGHENMVYNLAFNRDGTQLVSCSQDQTIRFWNIITGQSVHSLSVFGFNAFVQFSPRANTLACNAGPNAGIRLLDTSIPSAVKQLCILAGSVARPVSVAFSPDGLRLVSGNADQTVTLWDITEETAIYTHKAHVEHIKLVIFSPDGRYFLSSSVDGTARLWDVETGKCVHTFHTPVPYEGMNITGVTGISEAQRAALKALGAVER